MTDAGTYALVFECERAATVDVGRLGMVRLRRGYYVYIGSAFGPGGVEARVQRHWRADKRRHWHIDYLSGYVVPRTAWYRHGPSRDEHRWATSLAETHGINAVARFGASDCRCISHLFYTVSVPSAALFARIGGDGLRSRLPLD